MNDISPLWWLLGAAGAAALVIANQASAKPPPFDGATFRAALVMRAQLDVGMVREEGGKNRGPTVERYLAAVGAAPGSNWCAATVAVWIRDTARTLGIEPPIPGSAGAKATGVQLQRRGVWSKTLSRDRTPSGSIYVLDRSVPAWTSWQGHIGVIEAWSADGESFTGLEGNSGPASDECARMTRRRDDPLLWGAGVL